MLTKLRASAVTALYMFLTGCGGGSASSPVASTLSFALKTAIVNESAIARSLPFTLSGTANAVTVTGSGTLRKSAAVDTTFNGADAVQSTEVINESAVLNGVTNALTSTLTTFEDKNLIPIAYVVDTLDEYDKVETTTDLSDTAHVNDSGAWQHGTRYKSINDLTAIGTFDINYALEADSTNSALLKIIKSEKNNLSAVALTVTDTYRMTPLGRLTLVSRITVSASSNITMQF